ncbi:unnamed protein product, partial [marine sediment metagenome]
ALQSTGPEGVGVRSVPLIINPKKIAGLAHSEIDWVPLHSFPSRG